MGFMCLMNDANRNILKGQEKSQRVMALVGIMVQWNDGIMEFPLSVVEDFDVVMEDAFCDSVIGATIPQTLETSLHTILSLCCGNDPPIPSFYSSFIYHLILAIFSTTSTFSPPCTAVTL